MSWEDYITKWFNRYKLWECTLIYKNIQNVQEHKRYKNQSLCTTI